MLDVDGCRPVSRCSENPRRQSIPNPPPVGLVLLEFVKHFLFVPDADHHEVYRELYRLYSELHDAFGRPDGVLADVMKRLIEIRERSRGIGGSA